MMYLTKAGENVIHFLIFWWFLEQRAKRCPFFSKVVLISRTKFCPFFSKHVWMLLKVFWHAQMLKKNRTVIYFSSIKLSRSFDLLSFVLREERRRAVLFHPKIVCATVFFSGVRGGARTKCCAFSPKNVDTHWDFSVKEGEALSIFPKTFATFKRTKGQFLLKRGRNAVHFSQTILLFDFIQKAKTQSIIAWRFLDILVFIGSWLACSSESWMFFWAIVGDTKSTLNSRGVLFWKKRWRCPYFNIRKNGLSFSMQRRENYVNFSQVGDLSVCQKGLDAQIEV